MSHPNRLPSSVVQLARALVSDPQDGLKRYQHLTNQIRGLPRESGYDEAVRAIEALSPKRDVIQLASAALDGWRHSDRETAKQGYESVLGAVWEQLSSKDMRGLLGEDERRVQSDLREFFYPTR